MIDYAQALALILADALPQETEEVPLAEALGRVLATDICSPVALPGFDNSAMDGFALCCAGQTLPIGHQVDVVGAQAAGDGRVAADCGAFEIMTGARLPEGLDSVVPVEQVEVVARTVDGRPRRIRLAAELPPAQHIRCAGEDVAAGDTVLAAGRPLAANAVMLLAAIGQDRLRVRRRPRVGLITTGRELAAASAPSLAPGQIRNSNGPFLAAALTMAGAEVVHRETVGDEVEDFLAAIARALAAGAALLISTGAVSMGRHDFVPAALARIGATVRFHKLAIRPGKPLLYARLSGGEQFFGLPGNPASAAVGLRFFVEPALRSALGMAPETALMLPLAAAIGKKPGLQHFLKAAVRLDRQGGPTVSVLSGQESFRIRPLAAANAWVMLPAGSTELEAGERVPVYALSHTSGYAVEETVDAG